MKKSYIWIAVAALAILAIGYCWSTYNSFVTLEQTIAREWANVETQYQRRSDLIPNLVNTVKGYAAHEQQTLDAVVSARAAATSITVDAQNMSAGQFSKYVDAQNGVTSALGRLIAISENYPDLKANQNFLELQAQLEGTENRIAVARKQFNDTVANYNTAIRRFPANLLAGMFGFEKKEYFQSAPEAVAVPAVEL